MKLNYIKYRLLLVSYVRQNCQNRSPMALPVCFHFNWGLSLATVSALAVYPDVCFEVFKIFPCTESIKAGPTAKLHISTA